MTRAQVCTFLGASLAASEAYERRHYPLFLLLARTGMRLGEALALQWGDVDFGSHEVRVARAISRDRVETPKSGHGRTLDMSEQLARVLLRLQVERKTETLRRGWAAFPTWVFPEDSATTLAAATWPRCPDGSPGRSGEPPRRRSPRSL